MSTTAVKTRAKFWVTSVNRQIGTDGEVTAEKVTLSPVYSSDPQSENAQFWKATPSGLLEMTINNPSAWGQFIPGRHFYVDFTPADGPPKT